jgi:hypothetical protein
MTRARLNRTVLAVTGALLLAGGVLLLAGGLDLYGRLHLHPPAWWPLSSPHRPVVSTASRTRWTDRGWWWPVVIGGLSLLVLGCLAWLAGQLRRSPGVVRLAEVRVRSRALEDAVETQVIGLPEVTRVRTRLTGTPHRLSLRTTLHLQPDAVPGPLLAAYRSGPLADARATLARPDIGSDVHVHLSAAHPSGRARRKLV